MSNNMTFKPEAFVFDLDGTLCDTLPDLQSAMNEMLRRLSYPERSREELLSFINKGNRHFVYKSLPDGAAFGSDDPVVDRAMAVNAEAYEKCYTEKTREYPGITDMLLKLKARGMKLAILTNKRDRFAQKLSSELFGGIFDITRGNIEGYPAKPDPTAAFDIADKLGVAPKACVFAGDSDVDMNTAKNAGMFALGVLWGYRDRECLSSSGADAFAEVSSDIYTMFFD